MPPLHPDLEAFLELAAAPSRTPMSAMRPAQAREAYVQSSLLLDLPGAALPVEPLTLPCRDGTRLPARLYLGAHGRTGPSPVLLFFHGGGYVLGNCDSHDALCRDLAHAAQCAVLSVDYRLAPEHRFPSAFEDAEDAHRWLLAHGAAWPLDTQRLAIGGDSVGGTLATALCLAAREAGRPQPCLQLLLYPCTAAWQDSPSHQRYATGHLLEQATLQWMFQQCLRSEADRQDWRFAPLQAASLAGLAPAGIALAEHDPLVDEGLAYAERLRAAGVPVALKVYEGMVHDFARLGQIVPDAALQLRQDLAAQLRAAFA
ncbi:alpha/beta hydrolase [Ideonella azotifigens]|uniref:Alpha/beta hydrolase n=1 Tax=Ideonella azotifigens TaxID=513160 RepID=A0ABP3VB19_9BURK|nr:alpha/beta hydrolase [Ideonella azotifigens]MCD2344901.1 alpha/beta hydrolase [Ideonella azotifigens]